jgi:hypothetical protein
MLKKSLFIGTFFLLFIGLSDYGYGCHKKVDGEPVPHGKGDCSGGGGGGGGPSIPVSVTFLDRAGDRITSDGGPYIAKVDEVNATIRNTGDLHLFLTRGGRFQTPIRTLHYDFQNCVSPGMCNPPMVSFDTVGAANTFTSGIDLREMGLGEILGDLRLSMAINLDSIDLGNWHLVFNPFDADCSGSSLVTIERTGADTWEIEAGAIACLKQNKGGGEFTFHGRYSMPFKFRVETN